jgi:hypothetical protein
VYNEYTLIGTSLKVENMKFEVDTDTILEKVLEKITKNVENNSRAQGMSEEEIAATLVLNKKKLAVDAQNLAVFFTGLYVQAPAEEPVAETVAAEQAELPAE